MQRSVIIVVLLYLLKASAVELMRTRALAHLALRAHVMPFPLFQTRAAD